MNLEAKADFLKHQFVPLLKQLPSDTLPQWGKMSLQQMLEHFSDYVKIASAKTPHTSFAVPEDKIPKFQEWLRSDKPFKENTPNPLLPEVPPPVRNVSINEAFKELQKEIDFFFSVFQENKQRETRNPFYGDLNYELNVLLLYKHACHHLKQFGITI